MGFDNQPNESAANDTVDFIRREISALNLFYPGFNRLILEIQEEKTTM